MPQCRTCKVDKPVESFYLRGDTGKRRTECTVCMVDRQTARDVGTTLQEMLRLEVRAGGRCECCGRSLAALHLSRLSVDHDHRTGHIRGLLCTQCNTAIGLMDDDPMRLEAAIAYLKGARPYSTLVIGD